MLCVRQLACCAVTLVLCDGTAVMRASTVTILLLQGAPPTQLSFCQAQDGCLHVVWGPSVDSSRNSYTVYSRSSMPQTTMLVSSAGLPSNMQQ
jgi:hypothetical protein